MNRRQKNLLTNFIFVLIFTVGFVVFMASVRNSINSSEATKSMELLGKEVLRYRQQYGSLPSESYIKTIRKNFGIIRLGNIHYRAQWIEFGADANSTILAYTTKPLKRFFKKYHIVLWLDGRVEQCGKVEFEKICHEQQEDIETKWLRELLLQKQSQPLFKPDIF